MPAGKLLYTATAMPDPSPRATSSGARDAQGAMVSAWLPRLDFDWTPALQGASRQRLAKDETLFLEGMPADTLYIILEGRVRLISFGLDGKERHLMIIGANGLVGDCGLPASNRYVVTAVASADTQVAALPASRMLGLLESDARMARQQRHLAAMRYRIMLRHVEAQGSNAGRRRVCMHLLDLVNSYEAPHQLGTVITIAFTQEEMGRICGLSRVSVSQVFTALEHEGVIARDGRLIVVTDRDRLAVLAHS